MRLQPAVLLVLTGSLLAACSGGDSPGIDTVSTIDKSSTTPVLAVDIIEALPHDPASFTQGLALDGETMFESIGRYGGSALIELAEPEPVPGGTADPGFVASRRVPVDAAFFAEGLAVVEDRLIQLTWKEGTAFVYDAESLEVVDEFSYEGEGWGLCYQDEEERLVMSDGSATLTFRDPDTFEELGSVEVTLDETDLASLNELECVGDMVYANVWKSDHIAVINPADGAVTAVIDASGLVAENPGADVLNGIAYDEATDTFLVTGKLWPTMYRLRFVKPEPPGSP